MEVALGPCHGIALWLRGTLRRPVFGRKPRQDINFAEALGAFDGVRERIPEFKTSAPTVSADGKPTNFEHHIDDLPLVGSWASQHRDHMLLRLCAFTIFCMGKPRLEDGCTPKTVTTQVNEGMITARRLLAEGHRHESDPLAKANMALGWYWANEASRKKGHPS